MAKLILIGWFFAYWASVLLGTMIILKLAGLMLYKQTESDLTPEEIKKNREFNEYGMVLVLFLSLLIAGILMSF